MRLGVLLHLFNFLLGQTAARRDGDFLFLARAEVLGADMENAVGIDVKRHLDLRHAARRRRNIGEVEFPDGLVIAGKLTFALQNMDFDPGLIVGRSGENFRFPRGNGGVAFDQFREHAAQRFDAQGKRRHIEQQHILDFPFENSALNGRADRHDFVGIHALMGRFVDESMSGFNHPRHAGHPTHQDQFVDFFRSETCILQAILHRRDRPLEQVIAQLFHFRPGQFKADMLRTGGVGGNKGQIDFVLLRAGQGDLGFLGLFLDALQGIGLFSKIHPLILFEFIQNPIHQSIVPVVAAQMGVAVGRLDFENSVADFKN